LTLRNRPITSPPILRR